MNGHKAKEVRREIHRCHPEGLPEGYYVEKRKGGRILAQRPATMLSFTRQAKKLVVADFRAAGRIRY